MHPFFSRPERLFVYLASWLGLALLASFAVSDADTAFLPAATIAVPIALLFSFVSLSSWFLCRTLPLRETHPIRVGISVIAAAVIGGWLFQGIVVAWVWVLNGATTVGMVVPGTPLLMFTTGLVLYLISVIFHYLLLAFETSRHAERRSLEAEILARSSELKALRAQIDPHFLFNSLNSIAALITTDPERARTMTVQLADFFRSSVAAGRQALIPLDQELHLVETYLQIEQVRYGQRLRVALIRSSETNTVPVPPLILQPLVENAIKHGIAHLLDGGTLRIECTLNGDSLVVSVRNPVDPDIKTHSRTGVGFGLQAVRDRLKAVAPGKGFLDIRQSDDAFEVIVTIPTDLT